jgi:hypothetical protein
VKFNNPIGWLRSDRTTKPKRAEYQEYRTGSLQSAIAIQTVCKKFVRHGRSGEHPASTRTAGQFNDTTMHHEYRELIRSDKVRAGPREACTD